MRSISVYLFIFIFFIFFEGRGRGRRVAVIVFSTARLYCCHALWTFDVLLFKVLKSLAKTIIIYESCHPNLG